MAQTLDTAEDFITRVRERVTDPDADRYSNEEMLGYMNAVLRHITDQITRLWPTYQLAKSLLYEETWDLLAGQAAYMLPPLFYEPMQDGILIDGEPQPVITFRQYTQGTKDGVIFIGNQIAVSPTPTEDKPDGLKMYYVKKPNTVEAITDSVDYGDQFPDVIIEMMAMYCKARNNDSAEFQAAMTIQAQQLMRQHIVNVNEPENKTLGLAVSHNWI
jgi:hypothetical protein